MKKPHNRINELDITKAISIANILSEKCNDKSLVKEFYISYLIKSICSLPIPEEIGLLELPEAIDTELAGHFGAIDCRKSDRLWEFLSDQVEFISSFKNGSKNVIEASKTSRRRGGTYLTAPELGANLSKRLISNYLNNNPEFCRSGTLLDIGAYHEFKDFGPRLWNRWIIICVHKGVIEAIVTSSFTGRVIINKKRDC